MKSISTILKEERERKGLSIDDIVSKTKIRRTFIEAIEEGDFNKLPSEAYALGFIKNYAQFLGISESRAAALFRREYDSRHLETIPKFRKSIDVKKNFISSTKSFLIIGVVIVILSYLIFQFRFIFIGPKLVISKPVKNEVVTSSVLVVSGKTDPEATVLVNNEEVYVDIAGNFKKNLYVTSGDRNIRITAKNKFGKETKKDIQISIR